MARTERVIPVCDICGRDNDTIPVTTHTITIDSQAAALEACEKDWAKFTKALTPLAQAGRKIPGKRRLVPAS